ncbi:hypothetical protein VTH8203_04005 [Vibrio thalassae]|uniref:Uncharacterized protein n=1 Tax=Vibrio thalassae TaxID=1243014 RepID=A0A240ENZ4_9VIBR|nr:hypothetical protein [Vibrio thalassae]SNX50346.1 hypothetical protein VTH8203_04005 [Vibrio thalassae]
MANSKTEVQDAPDDVSKPLPYEDRIRLEESIKAATLLEQIAQFTYIEASGLFNTRDLTLAAQRLILIRYKSFQLLATGL